MNSIDKLIENLNREQKEAVLSTEGPNLIVAGAGSGKTRVLTTRLIHIINQKKAWPNQILCVTFTNKAAKEMQNRVIQHLKGSSNAISWLGTFHSISVKFLRRHAEALGYKSNFTILDTDDQKKLLRNIVKAEDLDAKKFSPQLIMYHIDQWKNKGLLPKDIKLDKSGSIIKSILKVYEIYQNKTKDLNAFDFGDLILFCVKLFEEHKDIKKIYNNNFKYILVDEFQDTNFIQNKWLNLIVAGAGSGKTRVLTTRLIHIINEKKAWPNQILCVTFTNKAAKEKQNRVMEYVKGSSNAVPWLGTFHSISVKFLRRHAEALGYKSNFTILDTDDQKKLIRNIVKGEDLDAKKFSPQLIMYHIDQWKNKGLLPNKVKIEKSGSIIKSILKVYKIYQDKTKDLNAFDFGDLILFCVKLFEDHGDIREIYQKNFKYILVDEFQDTNFIQNKWLNLLVNKNENICCVGDDDQSIYSWRGAEIKNFLTFDKIYKNCKVFKLEQNYRSTKNILDTASNLISNNSNRVGKKLWSSANQGELVKLNCYRTGKDEAQGVSDIIEQKLKKKYSLNDISILVRAIYQTREFEERFLQVGIGYRVLGGIKFYERAEIKDAVSYLRIIYQKFDDLALERVIGVPKRGVGESTLNQIYTFSKSNKLCLEDSIIKLIEKGDFY